MATPRGKLIGLGEPAPWFEAHTTFNARFAMASLGGRFVALVFFGKAGAPSCQTFLEQMVAAGLADNDDVCVRFAVTLAAEDQADPLVTAAFPKSRIFFDGDGRVSGLYGALGRRNENDEHQYRAHWLILDPMLRVYARGSI